MCIRDSLISGKYGLRNHFWPLESHFLMRISEKKGPNSNPLVCRFRFLESICIYIIVNKNKKVLHGGLFLSWCMFCTHVISFDNCLSSILQVLVGQKTQCPVNSVSTMATSVETCLAFRLRRLRRLCPNTKESFEPFDVTCLSSYWTGLGWLATFCKLCILYTIFVILQVAK